MRLGMGRGWCAGGEVCGMGPCGDGRWSAVIRACASGNGSGPIGVCALGWSGCAAWGRCAARAAAGDWAVCGRGGSGSGAVRRVGGWCGGLGRWDGQGSGGAGSTEPARGGTVGRGMGSDRRRWVSVLLIGCVLCGLCVAAWLVRCVCWRRRHGTGRRLGVLFGRVDGAADIGIADGAVCSAYAARIRRGVSRRDA
jgi:hypothetical protein